MQTARSKSRLGPGQGAVLGDVGDDEARTPFAVKAIEHLPQIAAVGLPAAAPEPMVAVDNLHIHRLEVQTTLTDPKTLAAPYTIVRRYTRHRDWDIQEYICEQNNHDSADPNSSPGNEIER